MPPMIPVPPRYKGDPAYEIDHRRYSADLFLGKPALGYDKKSGYNLVRSRVCQDIDKHSILAFNYGNYAQEKDFSLLSKVYFHMSATLKQFEEEICVENSTKLERHQIFQSLIYNGMINIRRLTSLAVMKLP